MKRYLRADTIWWLGGGFGVRIPRIELVYNRVICIMIADETAPVIAYEAVQLQIDDSCGVK